ncbi:hypothetical protein DENSPDRAFT_826911 [Dentipellis sp. KUC8613]|nr:hypothetical protein DENSPDRAFT_826911 [Dentipellis sp. KUC8613]
MDLLTTILAPLPLSLLALALPLAISTLSIYVLPQKRRFVSSQSKRSTNAVSTWLRTVGAPRAAAVVLHTLYMLHTLSFTRPPNIFTQLDLPLGAPISQVRHRVSKTLGGEVTPSFETLLTRLASFDIRTALARYGQPAVQGCTYCRMQSDFALHALPRVLLTYIRTAALVALLAPAGSQRRIYGIAALAAAALAEIFWAMSAPVLIAMPGQPDSPMWHDLLWSARHAAHLAIPLTLALLPRSAPSHPDGKSTSMPTPTLLATTLHTATTALARTRLLRYTRAGALRDPVLRARAHAFWAREHAAGEVVRADEGVRRAAGAEGRSFEAEGDVEGGGAGGVGELRAYVRSALGELKGAYAAGGLVA